MSQLFYRFFIISVILIGSTMAVLSQNNSLNNNISGDEIDNLPVDLKITGESLKAVSIAFEAFKSESGIPEGKKNIENYKVFVQQNKDNFFILFLANRTKDEINLVGGDSSLGVDVRYIIDKRNYKIVRRVFFR